MTQPMVAPPSRKARPVPPVTPALKMPMASARRCGGKYPASREYADGDKVASPTPTPMRSIASSDRPARASTSSTRGRICSEWVARMRVVDSATTAPSTTTAAEPVRVLVSSARIFTGGASLRSER